MKGNSDAEAIRMANNCEFALSSCAFAADASRAKRVASQLVAGMSAVNDLGNQHHHHPYVCVYVHVYVCVSCLTVCVHVRSSDEINT